MTRMLLLEDFLDEELKAPGHGAGPTRPAKAEPSADEAAAYERGYKAGWDDCQGQDERFRNAIGAEFGRNLQELGFTFHEARAHVLRGLEPLLNALIETVLPAAMAESFGASVVAELEDIGKSAGSAPIDILISTENKEFLETHLKDATSLPHRLVVEETLTRDQVFLKLGGHERQLDLGGVIDSVTDQIRAFTNLNEETLNHG